MHLLPISLLSILAGTLLLAKFKKETPGKFFTIISWFFIVVGFLLFIGFIGGGICRMTHPGFCGKDGCRQEMMMKNHDRMKNCNHEMMGPGCCKPGMDKGMCSKGPGCMPHDSTMKCCPKRMECDSSKMKAPK